MFAFSGTSRKRMRAEGLLALKRLGYEGKGDVTVISDGEDCLKRLKSALPQPATESTGLLNQVSSAESSLQRPSKAIQVDCMSWRVAFSKCSQNSSRRIQPDTCMVFSHLTQFPGRAS